MRPIEDNTIELRQILAENATDAFETAYYRLKCLGEVVESRIGTTKHMSNVTIRIMNPQHGICLNPERNLSLKYLLGEINWYMSGSNRVADIAKYAKMWNHLTDDGETVNSAYGYRMFTKFGFNQLEYCINKLKANPYDRQAVIHIKDADNKPTLDTPCTCLIQFTVYHGQLETSVYMRSNDVWLGLPYDVAFFTYLQSYVAKAIGLPVGVYTHTVGDLHVYEKHWGRNISRTITNNELCWDGTELKEELKRVEEGNPPNNELLRQLWRLNNGKQN